MSVSGTYVSATVRQPDGREEGRQPVGRTRVDGQLKQEDAAVGGARRKELARVEAERGLERVEQADDLRDFSARDFVDALLDDG